MLHMGLSWLKMSDFWWTDKLVDELITPYEANPCLCDTNLREYSNRNQRKKAVQVLAAALGCTGECNIAIA